jgi:HSP20 family protein
MPVVKWEPYQDAASLQRLYRMFGAALERSWMPAVDVIDTPEAYVLKVELAGMKPEDVHVELEDDVLTIKGERHQEEKLDTEQYQSTEWHYGAFQRSISLPRSVKREAIEATYEDGVVEVRVPKAAEVAPQRIELKVKGEERAIMKTLACSDMGIECDYVSTKPTAQEVKDDLLAHAQDVHSEMLVSMSEQEKAEMMRQMDERMKDVA